jgi:hypothetical protein
MTDFLSTELLLLIKILATTAENEGVIGNFVPKNSELDGA